MKKIISFTLMAMGMVSANLTQFAWALDAGYSDPKSAVEAFLTPLTRGSSGVSDSVKAMAGDSSKGKVEQGASLSSSSPVAQSLAAVVAKQGKLMYYRQTGQKVSVGGKMVTLFYDLSFESGPKKELMFVAIQPTMSGGYYVMDAKVSDQVSMDLPSTSSSSSAH